MVWTFIILGLLTSAWALYALIASFVVSRTQRAYHVAAVLLLAAAWTLGHQTGLGRLALVAAIVIECVARFRRADVRGDSGELDANDAFDDETAADDIGDAVEGDTSDASPVESDGEPTEIEPPPPPEPPPVFERQPLTSCVLLPTAWTVAPSVFHASLRRGGRRDAVLLDDESDEDSMVVRVGDILLEIESIDEPELRAEVNAAAKLAWEWPEATSEVRTYAAHVVFTTIAPDDTPPRDLVHLHHQAQAALAEFTNAIAVFWPDAGRLMSPANLPDLIARPSDATAMSASCVSFRVFEPQADGEPYVLDTAGLHALGLPDLQAFSYAEPDDSISAMLYELAERLFREGASIEPGAEVRAPDDRIWQVELRWSDREPRRGVLSLTCEEDLPPDEEPPATDESADEPLEQTPDETDTAETSESEEPLPQADEADAWRDNAPPTSEPFAVDEGGDDQSSIEETMSSDAASEEPKPDQDEPDDPSSGSAS